MVNHEKHEKMKREGGGELEELSEQMKRKKELKNYRNYRNHRNGERKEEDIAGTVILRLDRGIHLPLLFDNSCMTKLFDLLNGSPGQARG